MYNQVGDGSEVTTIDAHVPSSYANANDDLVDYACDLELKQPSKMKQVMRSLRGGGPGPTKHQAVDYADILQEKQAAHEADERARALDGAIEACDEDPSCVQARVDAADRARDEDGPLLV